MTKTPDDTAADETTFRDVAAALDKIRVHPLPIDVLTDVRGRVTRRRRYRMAAASVCAVAVCAGVGAAAAAVAARDDRSGEGAAGVASDPSATDAVPSSPSSATTSSSPGGEQACPLSTLGKDTTATVSLPCAVGAEIIGVSSISGQTTTCARVTYRVDAAAPVTTARVCAGDTRADGLAIGD